MTETPTRHPISWPAGWPRSTTQRRAAFKGTTRGSWRDSQGQEHPTRRARALTLTEATARLQGELDRLGAVDVILSTNVELRLDGLPRSGRAEPADPGAAVYFKRQGKPYALACDSYDRVADNVAALAAHVDALRAIERHGVGTLERAFTGYLALPAPRITPRSWREVFNIPPETEAVFSREALLDVVEQRHRQLVAKVHPDAGGSHDAMAELNRARDDARKELCP